MGEVSRCYGFRVNLCQKTLGTALRRFFQSISSADPSGRAAVALILTQLVKAAEAASGEPSDPLRGMPKFSGRMPDYFVWDWDWTNWLGAMRHRRWYVQQMMLLAYFDSQRQAYEVGWHGGGGHAVYEGGTWPP